MRLKWLPRRAAVIWSDVDVKHTGHLNAYFVIELWQGRQRVAQTRSNAIVPRTGGLCLTRSQRSEEWEANCEVQCSANVPKSGPTAVRGYARRRQQHAAYRARRPHSEAARVSNLTDLALVRRKCPEALVCVRALGTRERDHRRSCIPQSIPRAVTTRHEVNVQARLGNVQLPDS
jgi:hypothetical protein